MNYLLYAVLARSNAKTRLFAVQSQEQSRMHNEATQDARTKQARSRSGITTHTSEWKSV